jgi:hypothetical protein
MAVNQIGSGAGRWFGSGNVYLMKDVTGQQRNGNMPAVQMFKIGHSKNPKKRLIRIKSELSPNNIELLGYFQANESNRAETAAQNAAKQQLGFVKDYGPGARGNATDWFFNPQRKNHGEILATVQNAVCNHNYNQ